LTFSVADVSGSSVEITEETDRNTFLPACTSEEEAQLQALVPEFLTAYVNYTGSANRMAYANLSRLKLLLVKGGALSDRLSAAVGGLLYAQSYGDTILSSTIHGLYKISNERFLCDVSYVLQTIGHQGAVETEHNIKLVYLLTDSGLKVEAMTHY